MEHRLGLAPRRAIARQQVIEAHAATGVLGPLAQFGQLQEDAPGYGLLRRVEVAVGSLGRAGDGPAHAAGVVVAGVGQPPPLAPPPRLQQGVGQQRQRARLVPGVADDLIGQPRLQIVAGARRGLRHGRAQFGLVHRADDQLPLLQGVAQAGVAQAVVVEVGPQRQHDRRRPALGRGQQPADEGDARGLVLAEGE